MRTVPPLLATVAILFVVVGFALFEEAPAKGRAEEPGNPWATRISAELGVARFELERPPAGGLVGWAYDQEGAALSRFAHPREGSTAPVGLGTAAMSMFSCDRLLTSFLESGFLCELTSAEDPCAWADNYAFAWINSCR